MQYRNANKRRILAAFLQNGGNFTPVFGITFTGAAANIAKMCKCKIAHLLQIFLFSSGKIFGEDRYFSQGSLRHATCGVYREGNVKTTSNNIRKPCEPRQKNSAIDFFYKYYILFI
jgi:hypothetical protein